MFSRITKGLTCEACGKDELIYDPDQTFEDYMKLEDIKFNNIDELVDEAINEHLLFVCLTCRTTFKFTYKQLEKKHRQLITQRVTAILSKKEIQASMVHPEISRSMIYCGKCDGLDGKGSCQMSIYKNCKLKRLPHGL